MDSTGNGDTDEFGWLTKGNLRSENCGLSRANGTINQQTRVARESPAL